MKLHTFNKTINVILAYISSMSSLIYNVFKLLFRTFDLSRPDVRNFNGKNLPIILLHGSGSSQIDWLGCINLIANNLSGHPIYAFSMDLELDEEGNQYLDRSENRLATTMSYISMKWLNTNFDLSIEKHAEKLEQYVNYVRSEHENRKVILVGWSMGGLVANSYVVDTLDAKNHIEAVITIASPIKGTPLLNNYFVNKIIKTKRHDQMKPKSEFVKKINEYVNNNCVIKRMTFGGIYDTHVPTEYARYENPLIDHVNLYRNHFNIAYDENLWREVYELLNSD